jgi:hypothetical protein
MWHMCTIEAAQLKLQEIVFESVSQANMVNMNALFLITLHTSCYYTASFSCPSFPIILL